MQNISKNCYTRLYKEHLQVNAMQVIDQQKKKSIKNNYDQL